MILRKTKIVCTMGPAVASVDKLCELLISGMNIARLNFSHGDQAYHRGMINMLREASEKTGIAVAILIDIRGPEIRSGSIADGGTIELVQGNEIVVTTEDVPGTVDRISVSFKNLHNELKPGNHIYIADGIVDLEVLGIEGTDIRCAVCSGGTIGSRKNVNIRGVRVSLPAITDNDRNDIVFAVEQKVDYLAASFIRKRSDILAINEILVEHDADISVIAKIEDEEGVENIDEIIKVSDGIMVARGDLGVQIDTDQIPLVQKRIISRCNHANKPVITATQMLDSMISNPRPTRAEVTDVANAIFDGTDAVMLSGETAAGKYPVKAVETMHSIAYSVENSPEYQDKIRQITEKFSMDDNMAHALAKSAFMLAAEIGAHSIITPTLHGTTPKLISQFRPMQEIVAVTTSHEVERKLLLYWGIHPIVTTLADDSDEMIQNAIGAGLKKGIVNNHERIVIVAGIPINSPIMINMIKVHLVANVIAKGHQAAGKIVSGRVIKADDMADAVLKIRDKGNCILVTRNFEKAYEPLLHNVGGLIIEGWSEIPLDKMLEVNPDLGIVLEVDNAMEQIEDGLIVSIDCDQKLVFEGVIADCC
jgi:pyruvate kinase